MARPSAETIAALVALRDQLAAAPATGGRTARVAQFAHQVQRAPATVYAWLKKYAGYAPARKPRSDRGATRVPDATIEFVAASCLQGVRANNKSAKPIAVAMNIAAQNGLVVNVSEARMGALLRQKNMDLKTQAASRNHIRMRSLHPNHVHQIDPSLCLIYYMGGQQRVMEAELFYKNKPAAIDRVQLKVWRYTRYDHASSTIDVRYYEAAGENQTNLFEFLLYTWGAQPGRLSHGVPDILLWDKGSANTSAGIKRLLDALGVRHETHATHHAWAKGGVEKSNDIVERQFESRLRDEPVATVEALNASAAAWVRDYNANAIAHVDCRVRRDDGVPRVRDDLWSLILQTPEALHEMPPRTVCAWFMAGAEATRVVRDMRITFAHPQAGRSLIYDLNAWSAELYNGQRVTVLPLLMGACALRLLLDGADGAARYIDVEPVTDFDQFGRPLAAAVIGAEYQRAPQTASEAVGAQLAAATYGAGTTREAAEELKRKNTRPFAALNDGAGAVAHSHLGKAKLPARIVPAAQPLQTPALELQQAAQAAPRVLTFFEAAHALTKGGVPMNGERLAQMRAWYPAGVPEPELPALQQRLSVRATLRVIGSDATAH